MVPFNSICFVFLQEVLDLIASHFRESLLQFIPVPLSDHMDLGLLENSELCRMDNLIEQRQNKNS